ncbi:MAG: hypothetical protein OXT67_05765 [Zetaproteobacteria bacterium]|nr:hypothetical protein [Zetaproteobacteria bacterium]
MHIFMIGSGKLATFLGKQFKSRWGTQVHITATTTQANKLAQIEDWADQGVCWNATQPLEPYCPTHTDILFCAVAPQSRADTSCWTNVAQAVVKLSPRFNKIIWISSTSVYASPPTPATLTEQAPLQTEHLSPLVTAENILAQGTPKDSTLILRLAGLYGSAIYSLHKRYAFFQQQQSVLSPHTPQNMTSVELVARSIFFLLDHPNLRRLEYLNICDLTHPTRQELADQIARAADYPPVQFQGNNPGRSQNKIIASHRLIELGFRFE